MPKGSTDERFRRHVKALTVAKNLERNQDTNRARTGIPVSSKLVRDQDPEPTGASAIASPLSELDVNDRAYFGEVDITSTDGLFIIKLQPVKTIILDDANGVEVVFNYKDPYNP